jgi:hypothetical protein
MMIPPNWWLISLANCQQKKGSGKILDGFVSLLASKKRYHIFPLRNPKTSSPNEFWTSHPPRFEGKDQWMAVLGTPWFHCNCYFLFIWNPSKHTFSGDGTRRTEKGKTLLPSRYSLTRYVDNWRDMAVPS